MGKIILRNLICYSYHGCFSEENKIGSEYKLDIWVEGDFSLAEQTDKLSHAVDYVTISDIASEEMAVSSKLIEHVASRILSRVFLRWKNIDSGGVYQDVQFTKFLVKPIEESFETFPVRNVRSFNE